MLFVAALAQQRLLWVWQGKWGKDGQVPVSELAATWMKHITKAAGAVRRRRRCLPARAGTWR